MSERNGNSLFWLLAGMSMGTIIGALYAPRLEEGLRETVAITARRGGERMRETLENVRGKTNDLLQKARARIDTTQDFTDSAINAMKKVVSPKDQMELGEELSSEHYPENPVS